MLHEALFLDLFGRSMLNLSDLRVFGIKSLSFVGAMQGILTLFRRCLSL